MLTQEIKARVAQWLDGNYDAETKSEIRRLQQENEEELIDCFYKNLTFGTGGLRGLMGAGANRMNKYTVGMATQGLANYLKKMLPVKDIKAAIAYDSRNNSRFFAEVTANVLSANQIKVFLFEQLRPTPELSFTIRHLGCHTGVVLTASHNPKEYNGYKAYWADGGQVVPPHDKNIIAEVNAIGSIDQVNFEGNPALISPIGKEIDEAYLDTLKSFSLSPEAIDAQKDLKIVFTPIHGTGVTLVPAVLKKFGFTNLTMVAAQAEPEGNGDFPTVVYPNPEEAEALSMALEKAKALDADLLLGTDPDADRIGIAAKNQHGVFELLNGNQTATLLFNYLIETRKQKNMAQDNDFVAKTIVTTDLIDTFAAHHGIACYNTLTGFKYIAELIREKEGKQQFVCGGEESYGYLIGDKVRDKDAVASAALICEMTAALKNQGLTLFDKLIDIYCQFGFYKESLLSITKKGKQGAEEISKMMKNLRHNPPETINNAALISVKDYLSLTEKNVQTGETSPLDFPKSDVLQFFTADGSKISVRPSGTEPKIKFYFSVKENLESKADFDRISARLDTKIAQIIAGMGLNTV